MSGKEPLPAWSQSAAERAARRVAWPATVSRAWAWDGSTGAGVRVCILDSGIDAEHPLVGGIAKAVAVEVTDDGTPRVVRDDRGDVSGHGTACAAIIRGLAPGCELTSVRVLGSDLTGSGDALVGGLEWAIEQGYDVVNLSLSTRKRAFRAALYELADRAYFRRCMLVCSAHNMPVESFPWRFASVVSVGSHDGTEPLDFHSNPDPPVEFFARGMDLEVAWLGGCTTVASGNSFATPHIAAVCALVLGKHPELMPYELKTVLHLTASNVEGAPT